MPGASKLDKKEAVGGEASAAAHACVHPGRPWLPPCFHRPQGRSMPLPDEHDPPRGPPLPRVVALRPRSTTRSCASFSRPTARRSLCTPTMWAPTSSRTSARCGGGGGGAGRRGRGMLVWAGHQAAARATGTEPGKAASCSLRHAAAAKHSGAMQVASPRSGGCRGAVWLVVPAVVWHATSQEGGWCTALVVEGAVKVVPLGGEETGLGWAGRPSGAGTRTAGWECGRAA